MNIIKEFIKLQLAYPKWYAFLKRLYSCKEKKIILIGTPVHGNLGDHAIAEQEKIFLNEYFNDYKLYEVLMPMYHVFGNILPKFINDRDLVIISGGGWMGNLWLENEKTIRKIVSDFPNNQVVILPQTAYYTNDKEGDRELNRTIKVFSSHQNLQVFLRDQASFVLLRDKFNFRKESGVFLAPDMVLYGRNIPKFIYKDTSDVILTCLRNDIESCNSDINIVLEELGEKYDFRKITTVVSNRISLRNREYELKKMWKVFANSKLVITDRLHAMLFAVLNCTPCIVLNNKTGKVYGVLEWIKDETFIIKLDDAQDMQTAIEQALNFPRKEYNTGLLQKRFDFLAQVIREGVMNGD